MIQPQFSLSDIKEENLLRPPLYQNRPISNIFSPGNVQSENIDSSRVLSRNVENTARQSDRVVTRLVECEVEVETVQVVR
jgi:hypothetical protein